jgi:hypothetical protein
MILLAGLFLVVIVSLGLARSQQISAQSQLNDELGIANARVSNLQIAHLREQEQDLRAQLKESQARVEEVKDRLRNEMVLSVEITDEFFEIADACDVEVVSLSTSGLSGEELGDVVCQAVPFSGTVEGSLANIVSFIHRLNNDYSTGVVKSAQISVGENADSPSSVAVRLIAYTYEGN